MDNSNVIVTVLTGDGTNTGTTKATVAAGDLLIFEANSNSPITAADAADLSDSAEVYVVGCDPLGNLVQSPPIKRKNIKAFNYKQYAAPAEKVVTLGYNGTDGSINVANSSFYQANVVFKDNHRNLTNKQTRILGSTQSDASATEAEIAEGLFASFLSNELVKPQALKRMIRVELLASGTRTATGSAGNLIFTKGSKQVTVSAATAVDGTAVAVGQYLSAAAAASTAVYRVASISGTGANTIFTLAEEFQGESTTVAATALLRIASATNFGLRFTGLPLTYTVGDFDSYRKVDFSVHADKSFTTATAVRTVTEMSYGTGFWKELLDLERKFLGYLGYERGPHSQYFQWPASSVVVGTNYDKLVLEFDVESVGGQMSYGTNTHRSLLVAAYPTGGAVGGAVQNGLQFRVILNAFVTATAPTP